jgi:alpha-glucosidase
MADATEMEKRNQSLTGTTLYQGDELGMENVSIPPEKQKDPYGIRVSGKGRDFCRTPMQWNSGPNAGFSKPGIDTWLPLGSNYARINIERQLADETSVLNLYRRLLEYRRATPALRIGSYLPLDSVPDTCFAYLREVDGQRVLILLNFAAEQSEIDLPQYRRGEIKISTISVHGRSITLERLILEPYEGLVIELH